MKKSLFLAALVLISAGCFAQKSNVNKAKSLILSEESDFDQARTLIGAALQNDETKNQANTWYVAGLIGYQQKVNADRDQQIMAKQPDWDKVGPAIMESYEYWVKADEIAMTPTLDKKGREVVDSKTRGNIVKRMQEYYKAKDFLKYEAYLFDQHDFKGAYNVFMLHFNMPKLAMMQDEKSQAVMVADSITKEYEYYAAAAAFQAQMHTEAIALLEDLKNGSIAPVKVNQLLYQEYLNIADTATAVSLLQENIDRFPEEPWFIQNLTKYYLDNGRENEAYAYLDKVIAAAPQALYYVIKGSLLDVTKRFDEALAVFEEAVKLYPDNASVYESYGMVYNDMGNKMDEDALYLDAKAYAKVTVEINNALRKALPFFEKAYELEPDNQDYKINLRKLYYRLGEEAKYEALLD